MKPKICRIYCLFLSLFVAVALPVGPATGAAEGDVQFLVNRFVIDGEPPIDAAAVQRALRPFTGRSLAFSDLEAATSALSASFQAAGFPFYRVTLPPQRIVDGSVTLRVISFPLRNVRVEGNQHFDVENILGSMPPLRIGESPNTLAVARALQFANEHPSKRVAVFVKQEQDGEGINARVAARDTRPYQIFATVNNTGTTNPGRTRTAIGIQHSNLFNRDHVITATYTTSPENVSDVNQYGANYRLPIYSLATEVNAFYTYSQIDQGTVANFFDVSGRGQFYGFNATHTLVPEGAYTHKVAIGYQDRFFDNETRYAGTPITPDVRTTPVSFRYSADYEPKNFSIGGYAGWEFNSGFGDYNDQASYTANRVGADNNWNKFSGGGNFRWTLPGDFQLRGSASGQYSRQPLIPGEQFGIGGSRSVRGYEEREVTGDFGIQGSIEAWSPPLIADARIVLFADTGEVRRHSPHSAADDRQAISGAGLGIRWNWKGYVDISCDVAHAFNDAVTTEASDTRFFYQVFLRY